MDLDALVKTALANGASDLHLEPSLPPALRVRGTLKTIGEPLQVGRVRRIVGAVPHCVEVLQEVPTSC